MSLTGILFATSGIWTAGYGLFEGYYGQLNSHKKDGQFASEDDLKKEEKTNKPDSSKVEIQSAKDKVLANLKKQAENLVSDTNVFNLLLIGTDKRGSVQGDRSDSCIMVSINKAKKEIVLTSMMRDSYVAIPGYDNNRLNAAFALGGSDLLTRTIEHNFGLDVNRYVQVGFESFVDVIDDLGGIEMTLNEDEVYYVNYYSRQKNGLRDRKYKPKTIKKAGKVRLDGMQALAYSRIRKIGSDFERTNRQRKVIQAAFAKLKKADVVALNDIANKLLPQIHTDLSRGECISLLLDMAEYKNYKIASNRVPYDATYNDMVIDGMQVLSLDFDKNVELLRKDIYHLSPQ